MVAPPAESVVFNQTACWPFTDVGTAALQATTKKVFAHYFPQFPISIDNQNPDTDYYNRNFINPFGESNKHKAYGGYFRQRPPSNYVQLDMQLEVTRAVALGLDGFTFDMLSLTVGNVYWTRLIELLAAAQVVNSGFKIVLMPDMNAGWAKNNPETFVPAVLSIASNPALYRDANGAIVISPYKANNKTPQWWQDQIDLFANAGVSVVLWPVVPSITQAHITNYNPVSVGISEWDGNCVTTAANFVAHSNLCHTNNIQFMSPVMTQNFRPKEARFWEPNNSGLIRQAWNSAIVGNAEWIQIITWNDYSEGTELSPSTLTKYSFYDVSAYYLRWYKLGTAPLITRDALYYFHRPQLTTLILSVNATHNQTVGKFVNSGVDAPSNKVEALVFLTAPATVKIIQSGTTFTQDVLAGVTSVRTNLIAGATPQFQVVRNNVTVINLTSSTTVATSAYYQDLLYRGDGSLTCTRPNL
eukprot:gene7697-9012_t